MVTAKFFPLNKTDKVNSQQNTSNINFLTISDVLKEISYPKTVPASNTSSGIVIAVIDSGINKSTIPNYWTNSKEIPNNGIDDDHNGFIDDYYGWDFVTNKPVAFNGSFSDHGTFVSHIISRMTANVSNVRIMDIRVLNTDNKNDNYNNFVQAINYALLFPQVKVIQFSIEFEQAFFGSYPQTLHWIFTKAFLRHVAIVSVTGNGGYDQLSDPGNWPETIAVTSAEKEGTSWIKSGYANNGSNIDVSVPGSDIQSIGNSGKLLVLSGTSFSSAFVGGAVSLLEAIQSPHNLSVETIRDLVQMSASKIGSCMQFGAGLLNVSKLLEIEYSNSIATFSPVCKPSYTIPTELGPEPSTTSLNFPFLGIISIITLVSSKKLKTRKLKRTLMTQKLEN